MHLPRACADDVMLPDSSGSWTEAHDREKHDNDAGEHASADIKLHRNQRVGSSTASVPLDPFVTAGAHGTGYRRPGAFLSDLLTQLSSCCTGGSRKPTHAATTRGGEPDNFHLLDLVASNNPDVLVALDIFELAAKLSDDSPSSTVASSATQHAVAFSQILITHGRLPHGTEVAAAVEQALRHAILPDAKVANQGSESFEPQAGGPTTTLRMVSDLKPEAISHAAAASAPAIAPQTSVDTINLAQTLPLDPIHLYDLTVAIMTAALKPLLMTSGTTKLLGAFWWAEAILRGRQLSLSMLDKLAYKMLLHEHSSGSGASGQKQNRYGPPPSFTALQSIHEEFHVFECVRSVNVRGPEDILSDWNTFTQGADSGTYREPPFFV